VTARPVSSEVQDARGSLRPQVHFTADHGWLNDPHGIVWVDGAYHLFYQCSPGSTTWVPQCLWGHAVSPDLVHWRAHQPALEPAGDETGCWSGSTVVTDETTIDIYYTRVHEGDLGQGSVVLARPLPSGDRWATDPAAAVVAPPPELDAHSFRDPCIFRFEDHWVMVVGVGLRDGRGGLAQFVSPDRVAWTYTGVACARATTETEPTWTGAMWECPQLFEIDGTWVLLVSVWEDDRLFHVAAATGSYDGRTFVPRTWQQLTVGSSAYAMTSFVDHQGRRCVMSWLREAPDFDAASAVRAGAHSLTYVLTLDDRGGLWLSLHPDVELLRAELLPAGGGSDRRVYSAATALDLRVEVGASPARLLLAEGERRLLDIPLPQSSRAVIDGDIVEICTGAALIVHRLGRSGRGLVVAVDGCDLGVEAWRLSPAWGPA
jgi:beta-fructofuranosidase